MTGRISSRLEARVVPGDAASDSHVVVALQERGVGVSIDVPVTMLNDAYDDPTARHALQIRIKGRRDRMLFRVPDNAARSRAIETMPLPGGAMRHGNRGPFRGRR